AKVPQVFDLVQRFVSEVAVSTDGRLLLLNGEPGGGMFCLEVDRRAPPEREPLEACFPIGNGLVARCITTGLALQTRHGHNPGGGVSDPPSSRGLHSNTNTNGVASMGLPNLALAGLADAHALPLPDGYDPGVPFCQHAALANGTPPPQQPLSVAFRGWKKREAVDAGLESASTVPPPPASWEDRRHRVPGGVSPVVGSGGGGGGGGSGRGRSHLAFFPASDDRGSSRSPSPAGAAGLGASRGYGFLSSSPPPVGEAEGRGARWWSESESSPSPRHRQHHRHHRQRQRSPSPARRGPTGAGVGGEEGEEGVVLAVACLPVTGGDGGQAMMGVLKIWREQEQKQRRACGGQRAPDPGFSSSEMAALSILAGQAAAALRRLGAEATDREGVLEELDAAAADRIGEAEKRDAQVKEEMKRLREAMEHVSGSAKGLARQRDDARAALARAKRTLRRMVPALREVRDRQLGFRHYHDLIVNMSRAVLQDDIEYEAEEEGDRHSVPTTPQRRRGVCDGGCEIGATGGCGGGGGDGDGNGERRRHVASVDRHPFVRNSCNSGNTGKRIINQEARVRGRSSNRTPRHGSGGVGGDDGGGSGGTPGSPGPRLGTKGTNSGRSAPPSDIGFKVSPSPQDRAAVAMSLARSGGTGGDLGSTILTALRETAAAGGGVVRGKARVTRDRERSRER
ncbi:unnamed protein product, partial [Hapterophycus canaliculatus]